MNQYIQKIQEIALKNKYSKWYCQIIEKALLRPQNRKILKETKNMDIAGLIKYKDEYHSNVEIRLIVNQIIIKKVHLLEKKAKQSFKLQRINLGP